jgi:L-fuconolactonase
MTIVDTHCHAAQGWFEPIETLMYQMERNGVDKAVLIQIRGKFDNSYELGIKSRNPDKFAVAVLVDNTKPDAPAALEKWAAQGAAGIRLSPMERSVGPDPLAIWRKAAELGLTVSSLGTPAEFGSPEFAAVVKALPDLKIVIEHYAGAKPEPGMDWPGFTRALELAKYPSTSIKIGGFAELLPRPFPYQWPTFTEEPKALRMIYDAFGPRRMMWGSDFPPVASREGYANALAFPRDRVSYFTAEDKRWIFGETALSVWRFG